MKRYILGLIFVFLLLLEASFHIAFASEIKIGVLAKRGAARCLEQWSPTAEYLSMKISGHQFLILPLDFEQVPSSVESGLVHFILTNSAMYVELENRFGANRIATMKNKRLEKPYTIFAGVIFSKKDRNDIRILKDLKNKRFSAVKDTSFGGWLMAWRELNEEGILPFNHFKSLTFAGTHDAVVYEVLRGSADAGTVRTDTLERMEAEGKINADDFFILNELKEVNSSFQFRHSTRTYPEWPFAKVKHTSDILAEHVATALLAMPEDDAAARAALVCGWTIPANYQPVHDCLKELKFGPYENYGKVSVLDVIKHFWYVILLVLMIIIILTGALNRFKTLHSIIKDTNKRLSHEMSERELLFQQVSDKNTALETALSEVKQLSGLLPICASCKKIRDDKGYWNHVETYLHEHSEAKFSHGICPECMEKEYGQEDWFQDLKKPKPKNTK